MDHISNEAPLVGTIVPSELLAALNPNVVDPVTESSVQALLRQGESANTVKSYRAALRYWAAWFSLRYGRPISLPVSVASVVQFIVDHAERERDAGELVSDLPPSIDVLLVAHGVKRRLGPLSLNTLLHRLSVLTWAHAEQRHISPCRDPAVSDLVAKTKRMYAKRGQLPRRKAALTRDPLQAMLATCDDSLRGRRDRALLLFAWSSGGRRRSEVTTATMENLHKVGDRRWVYTLSHSKTNQSGADRPENNKPIAGIAADALEAWLAAGKVQSGPIFRRIRGRASVGEPLTPNAVRDIVRARAAAAGLAGRYSAHSLRSGFVTEAGMRQVPLPEVMALSGHASVTSVVGYFRQGSVTTGRAAYLADGPLPPSSPPDESAMPGSQ